MNSVLFGWVGLRRRREPPYLDVAIEVDFENGSFADSNPWQRATGHVPGQTDPVCRLSFGVSPLHDRISTSTVCGSRSSFVDQTGCRCC